LRHAGIQNVKLAISSIPDTILKGTDNLKIIQKIRRICPDARIIVTAESVSRALKMYNEGADYVMLPRILTASHLIKIIQLSRAGELEQLKEEEIKILSGRQEIIS